MRGEFLNSMKEIVKINGEVDQEIIIVEESRPGVMNQQGIVVLNLSYIGNICPPNYDIKVNDQLTRYPRNKQEERGSSDGYLQVLTVENIEVVKDKQQLLLKDRDRVVR